MVYIHETAEVSSTASIGEGTRVWHLVQIREDSVIGNDCNISKNVYVDAGVHIGNRVKIQNNVSVYHGVTLEDDVFVGPSAVFTNDFYPRAFNADWKVSETLVKQGASIGANATIVCGNKVGRYAMVGSGSVVTKDVPDYALVAGNPARQIGWVCKCGNKLNNQLECILCGKKYFENGNELVEQEDE